MNPKPETEREQVDRMLRYWFGGNSPDGPGRRSVGALGSNDSSLESTKASGKAPCQKTATESSSVVLNGTSPLPRLKPLSIPPNKSVKR